MTPALESYLQTCAENDPEAHVWYGALIQKKSQQLIAMDYDLIAPTQWTPEITQSLFDESLNILSTLTRVDSERISHVAFKQFFSYDDAGTQRLLHFYKHRQELAALLNRNMLWLFKHPACPAFNFAPHTFDWAKIIRSLKLLANYHDQVPPPFIETVIKGLLKTKKALTNTQYMNVCICLAYNTASLGSSVDADYLRKVPLRHKTVYRDTLLLDMLKAQKRLPPLLKDYLLLTDHSSFNLENFLKDVSLMHQTSDLSTSHDIDIYF